LHSVWHVCRIANIPFAKTHGPACLELRVHVLIPLLSCLLSIVTNIVITTMLSPFHFLGALTINIVGLLRKSTKKIRTPYLHQVIVDWWNSYYLLGGLSRVINIYKLLWVMTLNIQVIFLICSLFIAFIVIVELINTDF
jgi:hypothetical protein